MREREAPQGPPSGDEAQEERGLYEILGQAPLILFAVGGDGHLCLATGGLLDRNDFPRPEEGQSLLARFAGTDIGEALERAMRGERFVHLATLPAGRFEVHYFPWRDPEGRPGTVGLVIDVSEREQVLAELREADERLRIIRDRANEMISEQASDSRFVFVSRSLAETLGCSPEELLGQPARDLVSPEDLPGLREAIQESLARDEPARALLRLRVADGRLLWGDAVIRGFLHGDGTVHTVAVTRDVSEEREEAERRERRLALLERASEIGGSLVACAGGSVEAQLPRALAETGALAGADRAVLVLVSETGSVQRHLWWTADPEHDRDEPDRAQLLAMARGMARTPGEVLHVQDIAADPEMGAGTMAERGNRAALGFPLRTGDAGAGFLGLTRTRRAEGWEEDEIPVLRLLADALARGFVRAEAERVVEERARLQSEITGLGQRLISVPPGALDAEIRAGLELAARLSGLERVLVASWDPQDPRFLEAHAFPGGEGPGPSVDELRSQPWIEARVRDGALIALPERARFPEALRSGLDPELRALLVAPCETGPRFVGVLAGWAGRELPAWDPEVLERFRFVGELLTGALRRRQTGQALRESEEQLNQSQKMETVGRLAGSIAHDFNNLLTVISGNAEVAVQDLESPRDREDALAVSRAAERAARLTRDLLAFSRSRTGVREVVALNDVVRDVTALLERTLGDDIELDLRLGPEANRVEVDADRLRQIVVNLALNGRDAMPKGGRLTLDTRVVQLAGGQAERIGVQAPGRFAVLEVRDEGEGMEESIRERAFEPFFTTKRSGVAVGLGLSIAYSTLKEIGGAVELESRPDAGTCVRLYLPAARADAEAGRST